MSQQADCTGGAMPFPGLLPYVELGRAFLGVALEASENGVGLTINLTGGGYRGPYPAAAEGDPTAITVRDTINRYLQQLLGPPPSPAGCFLCTEPLHTADHDTAIIASVHAAVLTPAAVFCVPICTQCCTRLDAYPDLLGAIMQRYRQWLPDLHLVHITEPGHS